MILFNDGGSNGLRQELEGGNARVLRSTVTAADPTFTSLNDGPWHHVAVVIPNATSTQGDVILYVDGFPFSGDSATAGDLTIGNALTEFATSVGPIRIGDGINGSNRDFDGFIDDVRIYDEALDGTAVSALVSGAGVGSVLCDLESESETTVAGGNVTLTWEVFDFDILTMDNGGDVSGLTTDIGKHCATADHDNHLRPLWDQRGPQPNSLRHGRG